MPTPAQAAAATAGAGSLAAAGAYGITQAVKGEEVEEQTTEETPTNEMPTDVATFSNNENFTGTNYNTKLISLIKTSNLPNLVKPENNEKWWDWAFKNKYQTKTPETKLDALFNNLNGLSGLKDACANAYKADKNKYAFGNTDYLLKNISDYCTNTANSIDISEPKAQVYATAQANGYQNGVLSIAANAAVLVKKDTNNDNDLWWKWAYVKLYKPNSSTEVATIFSPTTLTKETGDSNTDALNTACEDSYKKGYQELAADTNKLLKNIQKFCSTNRTLELTLPEPATHKSIQEASSTGTYTSGGVAKEATNQTKLIDPDSADNNNWWDWAYTTQYLTKEESYPLDDSFKSLVKGKLNGGQSSEKSLAKACKDAYSKPKSNLQAENNRLLNNIQKFCTRNNETLDINSVS